MVRCARSFSSAAAPRCTTYSIILLHFHQDFLSNLAGGGLNVEIRLTGESENAMPLDHHPSWKLHKNPFWRVKHPSLAEKAAAAPHLVDGTGATMTAGNAIYNMSHQMYAYESSQDVEGVVVLSLPSGKKLDHLGVKIQFIGRIDMVWMFTLLLSLWYV